MERLNFVKEGVTKLPPGFRFQPTDEELTFQYLKRKIFSCPLPASIIPEINIYKYDPWDLPGDLYQGKYFFCNMAESKYRNGNRTNTATNYGYWNATGLDKIIQSSTRTPMMGMKKTLVFHRGKPPHGSKTDWFMHEFRLVSAETENSIIHKSMIQKEDWVICHIFQTRRTTKDYPIVKLWIDPSLSSSGSSGITEVFSSESGHEENSTDDDECVSSLHFLGREI